MAEKEAGTMEPRNAKTEAASAETGSKDRGKRKVRVGRVVSTKMQKTITVEIERLVQHAEFGRFVRRKRKFSVHDEENQCKEGDVIRFMETRPLSKTKRWRFVEFVERAK